MEQFDVVILGAGAAGLMCAMRAGQRGRRVLLLDHADEAGKKILISGGGRCNFTNLHCAPERFLSANPHFCTSALARYTQHDFIALVAPPRHRLSREDAGAVVLRRLGARRSSPCCWPNARPPASICGLAHRVTRHRAAPDRFRVATDHGDFTRAVAGAGDRRAVHPEDGRDRLRARRGAPLRSGADREPRPGLVPLTFDGAMLRSDAAAGRRVRCRRSRALRQAQLPRGDAVHPSRPVRPGHPADLVLLARRARRSRSTCCRAVDAAALLLARQARAAQGRAAAPSWPNSCRSAWRRPWPALHLPPRAIGRTSPTRR